MNLMETKTKIAYFSAEIGISAKLPTYSGGLGVLAGEEDEDTKSEFSTYTNPDELDQFLQQSGVLMLAPTIGTMHGPNKGKPGSKVKLNIKLAHELLAVADKINVTPISAS